MRNGADCSGWGSKQGSKVKTWKKRFFVLNGTEIVYYGGASGTDEKGRLRVVDVDFAPDLKNGLLIKGEKKGKTQVLKMKTATADESKLWFSKIKHAVAVADQLGDGVNRTLSYRTRSSSSNRSFPSSAASMAAAISPPTPPQYLQQTQTQQPPPLPRQPSTYPVAAASVPTWTRTASRSMSSGENQSEHAGLYGQSIRKKGWLLKEGKRMKSWKKRFMVLRGNVLTYYPDESSRSPHLGSVVIRKVETNFTTPFTLDLHTEGGRVLKIAADSLDDIESWDQALAQAISGDGGEKRMRDSLSTATSSYDQLLYPDRQSSSIEDSYATIPEDYSPYEAKERHHTLSSSASAQGCEGWLLKRGQTSKKWKKRYFTLNNDMLEYRHEPEDVPNEDEIIVDVKFDPYNDGWIHIELDSGRTITVRAESKSDFMKWAIALGDLVGKPYKEEEMPVPEAAVVQYREEPDDVEISTEFLDGNPPPSVVKYGWLLKQGNLIKSWKRRYFVLDGDSLQYYENIDKQPRGGGIVVRVLRDDIDENCLDVHLSSGRVLKLSADTQDEIALWYAALWNASKLVSPTVDNNKEEEESSLDNSGNRLRKLGREGWLLKKGQNFKTWKQRFFVLERSRLMYYGDESGELLGSGVVFEVSVGESRPFCLDVRFQNGRLLQVVAPDETEFAGWLQALQTASNLTESFLSQRGGSLENAVFDDEFDLDVGDDADALGDDLNFDNQLDSHRDTEDEKSGYSTWAAAMNNKPEWDRTDSWDSTLGDVEEDGIRVEEDSQSSGNDAGRVSDASTVAGQRKCHGWLNKEGGTIKTWKRRYFSLHGTTLRYFKSETGSLLRALTITHVDELPLVALGLEVATKSDRKLILTAESKEDYAKWVHAMQDAIRAENAAQSPVPVQSEAEFGNASSVSAATNSDGKVVTSYSGWLEKEGQRFKTWKKRYFTYKKGALIYYGEVGGVAQGHGIVTSVDVDESKPFTLRVQLENARILRVSAASSDEMDTWFRVLSSTKSSTAETSRASERDDSSNRSGVGSNHPSQGGKPVTGQGATLVVSRGEAREQVISERLDASDYLANDTISNESFLRIQDGHGDTSFVQASFNTGHRSFKGELDFTPPEEKESGKEEVVRSESDGDLEYYRTLLTGNEAELERRAGEKSNDANKMDGCAACCIVM